MRLALILPSNLVHAPYLNYYTRILDKSNVKYDIINWNKLDLEDDKEKEFTFNFKCNYNSNALSKIVGYYLFSKYVKKVLRKGKYDKLIVFIPQLAVFLFDTLKKEYKNKFILDIRDYGQANKYINMLNRIINISDFTVISSAGYKEWLPSNYDYVISHNTLFENDDKNEREELELRTKKEIIISNIGVIRNYNENRKVIDALSQSNKYILEFIGKGVCETDLENYCKKNDINNVYFYGKYEKNEELSFYQKSDFINLITPKQNYGNNTAMANRFYNACISRRPMIVSKGTYMSEILKLYNLGIEIDIEKDYLLNEINTFIDKFNYSKFDKGCNDFIKEIEKDQKIFEDKVTNFIQ